MPGLSVSMFIPTLQRRLLSARIFSTSVGFRTMCLNSLPCLRRGKCGPITGSARLKKLVSRDMKPNAWSGLHLWNVASRPLFLSASYEHWRMLTGVHGDCRFEPGPLVESCRQCTASRRRNRRRRLKRKKDMSETHNVITTETGVPIRAWTRGVALEPEAEKQLRNVAQVPFG